MQKRTRGTLDAAMALALFAATWLTRALSASRFVTWDEPAWVYRSTKFLLALMHRDPAGTMLVGHPGVLTMWSGALSLAWHRFVTGTVSQAQLTAIGALPGLDVHDPTTLRQLAALLPAAKSGIFILHGAILAVLFLLLVRLLGRRYAVAGALLLLCDPYYLGLSRILHMDALTSGLMLLAVVSALLYTREARHRYLALSAATAGLAVLTKSYGAIVAPFVVVLLAGAWLRPSREGLGRRLLLWLRDAAFWGAIVAAVFFALWPAMWTAPWATLQGVLGLSLQYASAPGDATTSFFRGQIAGDPGATFYPTVLLFRTTPLVLAGLLLALAGLFVRPRAKAAGDARRGVTLALAAYVLFYVAVITISKKKYDRYVLPGLLALDLLAAIGLAGVLELALEAVWPRALRLGSALGAAVPLLVVAQAAVLLGPLFPAHYLAYFNPLLGGPTRAVATVPVGFGEGIEQATQYLAAKPDAASLTVATWSVAGVAPAFPGQVVKLDDDHIAAADYVLLYIGDVQNLSPLAALFYGQQTPEYVVRVNGIEYAWLYRNEYPQQLAQELTASTAPGSALVTNTHSALDRRLSDTHCTDVTGTTEEEVAAQLQAATAGADHVVYLEFAASSDVPGRYIRRQLAQSGLLLWEKPFTYGTMRYYELPAQATFQPVQADTPAAADFGQQLLLESYGLSAGAVQYRQQLGLALAWLSEQQPAKDLHIFLRLVDEAGRSWGEYDGPLTGMDGLRTSAWTEGSMHLARLTLAPGPGIPPGPYWVVMGLYSLDDMTRLGVTAEGQASWATEFRVGPVDVQAPAVPAAVEDLTVPQPLIQALGDKVQLLGYGLGGEPYTTGEPVDVTLYWHCLQTMDVPYELELRLVHEGETVASQRFQPGGPYYPTTEWGKDETLRVPQRLDIPAEAPGGDYDLYLNWYAPDGRPLAAEDVLLTHLSIEHRERLFTPPAIQFPYPATFGDQIALLGYDLAETTAHPGDTVHLTLYWQALRPPDASYTVFTHLLDGQGQVRGQRDSVPMGGQRPTDGWVAGEVIVDQYELTVDADAQPGTHQIEVGLYEASTGQRLAVDGGGDRVVLPAAVAVE